MEKRHTRIMTIIQEKKGGPYTKDEKHKRLDEVHRLHFDYGFSARRIANVMKINRNTINQDVNEMYGRAYDHASSISPEYDVILNLQRLEIQRNRLRERLDKTENFQQQCVIEKMIFESDSKIINIQLKMASSIYHIHKKSHEITNKWMEDHGKNTRYMLFFDTVSVTKDTKKKIEEMIREERKKPRSPLQYAKES